MNESIFDVLIVGAGPAGSFAAERLARAGVRVALFDGRPDGEPKACGGGVTSKALKAWPHLLEAVGRKIDDLEMYSPSGNRIYLKLEEPFAIYSRTALDGYLRDRAGEAGARVFREKVSFVPCQNESELWRVKNQKGDEWTTPFIVGADGANSRIAKLLAGPLPNSEMEVAFGYRAPLPNQGYAMTVVAFLPGWAGYAWAFPRPDHISFGIATAQDNFDHKALDELLWRFMIGYYRQREDEKANIWRVRPKDKELDEKLKLKLNETAERYAARIPGLNPSTWDTRRAAGPSWALLGDAAGFADPVTGEGIYYAIRSAELFAECFLAGKPLEYEERWREDFGNELRRASQIRRRFYGNFFGAAFTDRMVQFAKIHPGIRKTLRQLVAGEQGYIDLKRTLAKRAVLPF
jgi:geranylgeranyl reductase family protein